MERYPNVRVNAEFSKATSLNRLLRDHMLDLAFTMHEAYTNEGIELSTLQRCARHLTSRTDITEAYHVGGAAAKAAFEGVTGQMVALKRISNSPYQCTTELHPISEVANLEKKVPLSWMNENHTQMTEEFLEYARPLIQAELTPLYIAGLPHHIYLKKQK